MGKVQKGISVLIIYCLIAAVAVFSGVGFAREYAPDLYEGFSQGIRRLPYAQRLWVKLPALPPLLSGEAGVLAAVNNAEPEKEDERIHLIDEEEMRGVWIATVYSIDFPRVQRDEAKQKQELIRILQTVKDAGLNTVFFQVRPHGDALYASDLFPWSVYLTGEAGRNPGYDPFAFLIEEAEHRGIRVHAWINPYRLTMGTTSSPQNTHYFLPDQSPVKNRPDLTMACGDGKLYLNPGEPEAMQLVIDGVKEIVEKYNVDGIHFDDYFYPSDTSYDDSVSYEKYGKPSGLTLADWRRRNTTTLMKKVRDAIKEIKPGVEFGISPSGIWQNKQSTPLGSDTNGFESYNRIYADSRLWISDEIVDYIVPQIYWAIGTKGSDYDVLTRWWRDVTIGTRVKLYIGHAAYRVGNEGLWQKPTEIGNQLALNRVLGAIDGSVFYGYSKIEENALGLRDQLREFFLDMELAQPLKIAYPSSGASLASAKSYIIGSADPRYTLTMDGQPVERTVSGYFSVYVNLSTGKNEFVFRHQDTELVFVLHRSSSSSSSGSGSGSGAGTAQEPAVTKLPSPLVYKTKEDQTVVRASASGNAERLQPLKKGVMGYVLAEANGYYLMDSGNWTYKPNVEILTDKSLPACQTGSAVLTPGDKYVELSFQTPYFPSYYVQVTDDEVWLSLHKTKGQPMLRKGPDPLFGEVVYEQKDDHAVYKLPLRRTGRLYGYHIQYDEAAKTLTFRFNDPLTLSPGWLSAAGSAPVAENDALTARQADPSGTADTAANAAAATNTAAANALAAQTAAAPLPLAGKVIVLDAGHGGRDNGATGPAGERGKLEKDVNLDLALALEKVLTEAGASVRMIRTQDVSVELESRANRIREIKPDLALSLHRNSMGAERDISTYFGVLALYTHPQSASLAEYLRDALIHGTTHHDGGVRWQSLAMARIEECPAVLLELGFISNPADYERMTRKSMIQKEAQAILRGLIAYMADS